MALKILLADHCPMMCETLRAYIARQRDLELIAETDTGLSALELTQKLKPDIVILNNNLPDIECSALSKKISTNNPQTRVLVMSMHPEQGYADRMFASGASGYMLSYCAHEELNLAIRTVARSNTYLGPGVGSVGSAFGMCMVH